MADDALRVLCFLSQKMGMTVSRGSPEEIARHRLIEKTLKEDEIKMASNFKLLLLGTGDSGKSTIVKQMRILHTGGFTEDEVCQQRTMVYENILSSMTAIIRAMSDLEIKYEQPANEMTADLVIKAEQNFQRDKSLGLSEWTCIKSLWADAGIQRCHGRSNEYQLSDSSKYFFDSIDRICQPDYRPVYDDILRVRMSTVGIVEITFPLRDSMLTIIDVGGQRSQRKKWIHCFEGVHSLIFIAAMSEYNQTLYECEQTNRMAEALQLFNAITSCQWFRRTPVILFLNKKDLFEEKLSKFPLSMAFPEYKGSQDYVEAALFIEQQFEKRVEVKLDSFYTHRTCATDTKNVEFVMDACFDIILTKTLSRVRL